MHKQLPTVAGQHTMPPARFHWPVSAIVQFRSGAFPLELALLAATQSPAG